MASNVSSLVNVKWFFGIPFNDSVHWRLTIAEESQKILGKNLLGLQAGNEPDFYAEYAFVIPHYTLADLNCVLISQIRSPYCPIQPSRLCRRSGLPHQFNRRQSSHSSQEQPDRSFRSHGSMDTRTGLGNWFHGSLQRPILCLFRRTVSPIFI